METQTQRPRWSAREVAGLDVATWLGVAVTVVIGAWLRLVAIGGHLPQLVEPDEPTTVDRAVAVTEGTFAPPLWDWPPGGAIIDAAALRLADLVGIDVFTDVGDRYLVSRVVFAALGLLVIPAGAVLAGRLATSSRARRVAGVGTAAALAVSFLLVRFGRQVHPDPLQSLFVVLAALAALRARGDGRLRWFAAAGVAAGLAAAMKFVGGIVVVPVAIAALAWHATPGERVQRFAAVGVGSLIAFVVGTGGAAITDLAGLVDGLLFQFDFQGAPRLGYEGSEAVLPWLFGEVLPGTLGWPLAVLGIVGIGWLVVRARPGDRFVAGAAVALLAFPLLTSVRFPHYVLPALPLVVVAGSVLVAEALAADRRGVAVGGGVAALAVVVGSWLPVSGDLGLVAAARGPDTRELAAAFLADADPRTVVAEAYALAAQPDVYVGSAPPVAPEGCRCFYVLSTYNEDRYRRLPDVYGDQLATFDDFLADADVAVRFEPDVPLDYRWNLLPQWGVGGIAGQPELTTGPTVTIVRIGPG